MTHTYLKSILLLLSLVCVQSVFSEVKLSGIFGDNMIIQRDAPVRIWGKADKREEVTVKFNGQEKKTKARNNGYWEVTLDEMPFGGPYELNVSGKTNNIHLNNILIGDIWICSGQSNMEFVVKSANNAQQDIEDANYPLIRSVNVKRQISALPLENIDVTWEICSPETVGNFTAVGYFYARELHKELNIPVGIINTSWGATGVRTWTSRNAFDKLADTFKTDYDPLILKDFSEFETLNKERGKAFYEAEKNDIGLLERWYDPMTDTSSWSEMNLPRAWVGTEFGRSLGTVWYNNKVDLPESVAGDPGTVSLGIIDDGDIVWVNGVKVGENRGYNIKRIYEIPEGILKAGENTITIMVNNSSHTGGFVGEPESYFLQTNGKYKFSYPLTQRWKYKKSAVSMDYGYVEILPNIAPSLLYNAMINPFIKFRIKGSIWYQGEHDTIRGYAYRTLFPTLINDWRNQWGYEFPFYWVQLANMNPEYEIPRESTWAELREAQTLTLELPQTGQAVIYDLGETYDVHPRNKQDVGARLAFVALNKTYGYKDLVYTGPVFKSYEIVDNKVIISFDHIGSGLCAKNNKHEYITGFAIAGEDKKFEWAKAYIRDNKVVVFSDKVKKPVAVRYAWGDNPGANLYNKEGLLTVPFRTDSWKGITEK